MRSWLVSARRSKKEYTQAGSWDLISPREALTKLSFWLVIIIVIKSLGYFAWTSLSRKPARSIACTPRQCGDECSAKIRVIYRLGFLACLGGFLGLLYSLAPKERTDDHCDRYLSLEYLERKGEGSSS
jgi:hypothetical protein